MDKSVEALVGLVIFLLLIIVLMTIAYSKPSVKTSESLPVISETKYHKNYLSIRTIEHDGYKLIVMPG